MFSSLPIAYASACASPAVLAMPNPMCGRGIADQRDAPEHQLRRGENIDWREERAHVAQAVQELRRHDLLGVCAHPFDQILADERRRNRVCVLPPTLVYAHPAQRFDVADTIPDEIVAPMARPQATVSVPQWISNDLLLLR